MTAQIIPENAGESKARGRKSKRSDPWFKRYPDDFFKGTRTLSLEARGAYNDILDLIYMNGGPIPDDDFQIACALRVKRPKWQSVKKALVDAGKLTLRDGFISNERAEDEIFQRENARKSYASRVQNQSNNDVPLGANGNETNEADGHGETTDGLYARAEPEARSQKAESPESQDHTKIASVNSNAEGVLAGLNGSAEPMLRDVLGWMHGGTKASAEHWLTNTASQYGQNVIRDSYTKLKTDLATGFITGNPLRTWIAIAQRMSREPQRSQQGPPALHKKQATALANFEQMFGRKYA